MSVPELHDAVFRWPHPGANDVIVTGQFDSWSGSKHHLTRTANGFEGAVQVPWGTKFQYKYIVDGNWTTTNDQPTELDSIGNLNNVYHSPVRPTPPPSAPESAVEPAQSEQPAGQANGILATAKNAAVAMVEAIAPGTTQTPVDTPAATSESEKQAPLEVNETAKSEVSEPTSQSVEVVEVVPTPKEEITAEAVLPEPPQDSTTAPVVPVPVLPLTAEAATPVNGHAEKPVETVIVEGSAVSEPNPATEPSTHTPAPLVGDTETVTSNGTLVEPSTHTPAVAAEKSEKESVKPDTIPLPPPTPGEVPLPATPGTPAVNGKSTPAQSSSQTSTPTSSPRKEKRISFPSFGRHHRHSSSASVNSPSADEHGALPDSPSPSRSSTMKKKRTNSVFGKLKTIFSDEHKEKKK